MWAGPDALLAVVAITAIGWGALNWDSAPPWLRDAPQLLGGLLVYATALIAAVGLLASLL